METAPLNLAHSHARNAIIEIRKANPIAASEEHDLAAGEFANAAKGTSDHEALRTLRLLEEHHLRLAAILKITRDGTSSLTSPYITEAEERSGDVPKPASPALPSSAQSPSVAPPLYPQSNRDHSTSIASNLATARGIPPSRRRPNSQSLAQVSTQTAEGRVVSPPRKSKLGELDSSAHDGDEKSGQTASSHRSGLRNRPPSGSPAGLAPPPPIVAAGGEEPFARFYSTFNNLMTTLSAPLAFAGLPLTPAEAAAVPSPNTAAKVPAQSPNPPPQPVPSSSRATADPELTRLFSRAALRAAREENGLGPAAESFYVVPTTGGTMSYAGMLANMRQTSNTIDEEPDAEFVDARETPAGNSPVQSRYKRNHGAGSTHESNPARRPRGGSTKTWEELSIENETLKNVVVDLGDRLRAFELGAQKSSLALHASMRQFSSPTSSVVPGGKIPPMPGSGAGPLAGLGAATKPLEDRIRELEEELKAMKKDNRKLGRENQKYLNVIEKYRERWEALKEGARERVKGGSSGGGAPPPEGLKRRESSKEEEEL